MFDLLWMGSGGCWQVVVRDAAVQTHAKTAAPGSGLAGGASWMQHVGVSCVPQRSGIEVQIVGQ
jgi:hypothetical protein